MSEGPDEGAEHRPLPSVGIPLLREEVRATRARRLAGVAVALCGLVGSIAWGVYSISSAEPEEANAEANAPADVTLLGATPAELPTEAIQAPDVAPDAGSPQAISEPLTDGDGSRRQQPFGNSPGFQPALIRAGCSNAEAVNITSALQGVLDFRRCRPEHQLLIERDGEGNLTRFEYRANSTQIYRVEPDDEGTLAGQRVEVPVERVRIRRAGTIDSSLGAALERAGLGRTLVGTFIEVFERHVNFETDTRRGDTFRLVLEEERIGGRFHRYGQILALEVRGERLGHHQAFHYSPREELEDYYDDTGRAVHGGWLRTPLHYDHISSPFDPRRMHPVLHRIVPHNGIDYAAGSGTPVNAAASGTVTFIGPRGANGNLISLRHENGYESHYAHLLRFARGLSRGDRVQQRQLIGYVGSTGRSTGPHLHFGLKRNGHFLDPQAELNGPGRLMPSSHLGRYRHHVRRMQAELERADAAPTPPPEAAPEVAPNTVETPTDSDDDSPDSQQGQ